MWCRSLRESLNARPSATGSTRPNSPSSSTHLPDVRSNVAGIWQYQSQQALGAWLARSCGRRNLVRWGLYPRPRQPGAAGPLPFRWSRYRGGFPTWWRQIPGRAGVPALQRRWPTGARLCAADLGPWGGSGLSEVGAAAQLSGLSVRFAHPPLSDPAERPARAASRNRETTLPLSSSRGRPAVGYPPAKRHSRMACRPCPLCLSDGSPHCAPEPWSRTGRPQRPPWRSWGRPAPPGPTAQRKTPRTCHRGVSQLLGTLSRRG